MSISLNDHERRIKALENLNTPINTRCFTQYAEWNGGINPFTSGIVTCSAPFVSVNGNQFTLQPGVYMIDMEACGRSDNYSGGSDRFITIKLYVDNVLKFTGPKAGTAFYAYVRGKLNCVLTLTKTSVVKIESVRGGTLGNNPHSFLTILKI